MARLLSETERTTVSEALAAYAEELSRTDKTGNHAVDRIIETRRDVCEELSAAFDKSHRASLSLDNDDPLA